MTIQKVEITKVATPHRYGFTCSCGTSVAPKWRYYAEAERASEHHIRECHSRPQEEDSDSSPFPRLVHARTHEESLSVPNASDDAPPTDDVQSPHPPRDNVPERFPRRSVFSKHCRNLFESEYRDRWALFTNDEINCLLSNLTAYATITPLTSRLEKELTEEQKLREQPHGGTTRDRP